MMQGMRFSPEPVDMLGDGVDVITGGGIYKMDLEDDFGDSLDVFSQQRIKRTNEAVDQVILIHIWNTSTLASCATNLSITDTQTEIYTLEHLDYILMI